MRFFFDVSADRAEIRDPHGEDFAHLDDAFAAAAVVVADLAREHLARQSARRFTCKVRDEVGTVLQRTELVFRTNRAIDRHRGP